jgi:hypothetical protein
MTGMHAPVCPAFIYSYTDYFFILTLGNRTGGENIQITEWFISVLVEFMVLNMSSLHMF